MSTPGDRLQMQTHTYIYYIFCRKRLYKHSTANAVKKNKRKYRYLSLYIYIYIYIFIYLLIHLFYHWYLLISQYLKRVGVCRYEPKGLPNRWITRARNSALAIYFHNIYVEGLGRGRWNRSFPTPSLAAPRIALIWFLLLLLYTICFPILRIR